MRQWRVKGDPLVHAKGDANRIFGIRIQLRNGPAKEQGNHGSGTAVIVQIESHKFGFRDGDTVYGVPVIILKARRSDEIQCIGHFIARRNRKIVPVCHGVYPLFF